MSKAALAAALLTALLLSDCAPDVLGRYKYATCFDRTPSPLTSAEGKPCTRIIPHAGVGVVMIRATPPGTSPGTKSLTDLSDRGQGEAVARLGALSKSPTEFWANLAGSLKSDNSTNLKDETLLSGTLGITIFEADTFDLADRIDSLLVKIEPQHASVETWTAAQSLYSTIAPGTITSSNTVGGELDVGAAPSAGLPITAAGKVSGSATQSQTLNVSQQVEDLRPVIDNQGRILIYRQGGYGRNLAGNVQVTLTLRLDPQTTSYATIFTVVGLPSGASNKQPTAVALKEQATRRPADTGAVKANVTMTYYLRHVISGADRYEDAKQGVQEIRYETPPEIQTIVPERFVAQPTFGLELPPDPSINPTGQTFVSAGLPWRHTGLCFESYETAQAVLDYLNQKMATRIGAYLLGFPPLTAAGSNLNPLTPAQIKNLRVSVGCLPSGAVR